MNILKSLDTHWKGVVALSSLLLAFLGTVIAVMSYLESVIELKASQAVNIEHIKKIEALASKVKGIDKRQEANHIITQNKILENEELIGKIKHIQPVDNIEVHIDFALKESQPLALSAFHLWGYSLGFQNYGHKFSKITRKLSHREGREKGVVIVLDDTLPKEKALRLIRHLYKGLGLPITHINKVSWHKSKDDQVYKYTVSVLALDKTQNVSEFSQISKLQIDEVLLDLPPIGTEVSAFEKHITYPHK